MVRETMALKAAAEPMLIRSMKAVIVTQKMTERRGKGRSANLTGKIVLDSDFDENDYRNSHRTGSPRRGGPVTSERPSLSRCGGKEAERGTCHEHDKNCGHDGRAGQIVGGDLEDLGEVVAGW